MEERLLNIKEVREKTSLSQATIYRKIRLNKFPKPVKLSESCSRWKNSEIEQWIASLT
ncbi:helix-turn-helix transcriptional regulator [Kingella negevensis]|uniref:Prophage CP4-57 regulatory protein (AlpA) n=1 Tax=Kingella negevensis TaxID=1522312 RepID=A0A238T8U8_9NEIS|nr:AlpA family phage regulatory protein [Kingella negevensis]MDK4680289.1 AlpA family phage regulatory protein [Kingella negevensis]MDK4681991.1 AlpA family phage regulatory protein [Kingella negevensis]MDK4684701.1 AlpA family phage regulatory protein [Kingella negevensis]MDK4688651.1 AlpA family phage regulatory protein [Kingella negevensis]MDK4690187.1 AlpA family phage regulatory protein [Kingella negevensis]